MKCIDCQRDLIEYPESQGQSLYCASCKLIFNAEYIKKMNKNYVSLSECPYCSHKVDSAINEFGETVLPKVGDITLCIRCGEVSEFDSEMNLIKFNVSTMNVEELMDIRHKQLYVAKIHYKEAKLQ